MGYTIDIDTGGTFTDGFFAAGEQFQTVKTPTTPHDLTLCFMECIREGAKAFQVSPEKLLTEAEVVRFSNTIGTNAIIERTGARIGLLLTAGSEALAPTVDRDGKAPLVEAAMVAGLRESVGCPPAAADVLASAQHLIDQGAHCLVVAFNGSDLSPDNERLVRSVIKAEYPRDYLGSVPVFLASDVSSRPGYGERINTALLNAYIHGKLARLLYKAGEELRRIGFMGQLLIGHNNGAVARVAKTRAINTYNSGPAAGLLGAREIAGLYGADLVVSADMGGTSFDIGVVRAGRPGYALRPDVEGFRSNLPMLAIRALGWGGGSIAAVDEAGTLTVGPRSAGALPGPACFDLGGVEPTVTDANLVLGLIDPAYFLGGRQRLDGGKAHAVLQAKVAAPLEIGVTEAATRVKAAVDQAVGDEIRALVSGEDTERALMLIYGGAGPLHACAIASRAGIRRVLITPFSAVFSAYSSSLMDVGHLYYARTEIGLHPPSAMDGFALTVADLRQRAERDMRGEGFDPAQVHWSLDLVVHSARRDAEAKVSAPVDIHDNLAALEDLARTAMAELGTDGEDTIAITSVGLFASAVVPHFRLRPVPPAAGRTEDALKGRRAVHLEGGRAMTLPVYDRDRLGHGHAIDQPCLIESAQTTILVPPGWAARVDRFDNIVLEMGQ